MESDFPPISPLRFFGICLLLLVLANWLPDSVFAPLNRATASLSGECLALFGKKAEVAGDMLSLNGFRVRIVNECTALYTVVLFSTFLLSVQASLKARLAGLAAGAALLGSVNILRIAAVITVGSVNPALFEIVHVYLGQIVMMLTVVATALVWLRWSAAAADPFPLVLRAGVMASVLFLPWLKVNRIYVALLDKLVVFIFAVLHPEYLLNTPRPLAIYNHTFEVPFYLSLIYASRAVPMRRRAAGAVAGVLVIAGWNTLFRVTHVIWTAYGVGEIEPFHNLVYLLGQYLLPFFLWLLVVVGPLRMPKGFVSRMARFTLLIILFIVMARPTSASAEVTVAIQPNGHGGFTLRAQGLDGVTGGEIRIDYLTDGQSVPAVSAVGLGAQTTLQARTDSPGTIVIDFMSPKALSGNGYLAMVQLADQDSGPGRIASLSAVLHNVKGGDENAATQIENPPENNEKTPPPDAANPRLRERAKPGPVPPQAGTTSEGTTSREMATPLQTSAGPPQTGAVTFRRLTGVLDRFCGHAGGWTPDALDRIFAPVGDGEFRQEPALFLTDGSAEMQVVYRLKSEGETVKCFMIKGAQCTSVRIVEPGEWLLLLAPGRGTMSASVTVQTNLEMVEYPLTVAPPLSLYGSVPADAELPCRREFVKAANERAHQGHFGETGTDGSCDR